MACIKSAQRAAQTALAPDAPYLAAGTMTGAIDLSFSNSANIEIFRLDFQSDSPDLPLLASAPSPDRFNRLSWSRPGAVEGDSFALGLLADGLSDGSVAVWNPLSMISSEGKAEDAMVARLEKHTGPVCGLEFSELTPNRLASGAEQGELCIWDLKNPVEPIVYPPPYHHSRCTELVPDKVRSALQNTLKDYSWITLISTLRLTCPSGHACGRSTAEAAEQASPCDVCVENNVKYGSFEDRTCC
ncbi:protein transport protein SEC31 homolog B-like isoform X2 [Miscanthus floridulus]|uniref:protein transport protein SEC31 homolog B-like isoform X2 n=1 Tax=Miscanthus floridulus TaxID=154761 RepID=UPI00345A9B32